MLVALLLEGEPLSAALLRAKKGLQAVGILHVYPKLLHASEFFLALAGLEIARELPLVHPHFHAVLRPKVQIEARLRRVGYVALLAIEPGIDGPRCNERVIRKYRKFKPYLSCFAAAIALGQK